ncbi:MAG: hypothetical protein V1816_25190 [Pseudomonadota bacterium]
MDNMEKMEALKDDLDAAREAGDAKGEAEALYGIGRVYFKDKVFEAAEDYWGQCRRVCRDHEMRSALIQVLLDLAETALAQNDPEGAAGRLAEAEATAREKGLIQELSKILDRKGGFAVQRRDFDGAVSSFEEGLDLCRKHDDRIGSLYFLEQLIPLYKSGSRTNQVAAAYRAVITFAEKLGDRERMALGLTGLADWLQKTENPGEAEPYLVLAHDIFLRIGRTAEAELIRRELKKTGVLPPDVNAG